MAKHLERHFSVKELAATWGLSEQMVRRMFEHRDDVLKIAGPSLVGKRRYTTLRIPESVVARVYNDGAGGFLAELKRTRRAV